MARRGWFAVLLVSGPWSVTLAQSPRAPAVEDLVNRVLERSPTLQALQARFFAAQRAVRPAGALADPMIEVGYRSEGRPWDPMPRGSMAEVVVTQALPFPGKRQSRRDAAQADAQVAAAEVRAWQQRVVAQVRHLYSRVHALDREQDILQDSRDLLDLLQATTATRHATGQADQEALVKVQMERLRFRERLTSLQAQREEVVASLSGLLDEPPDFTLGSVTALPDVSLPQADLEVEAKAHSGAIAVARARLLAAQSHLARLRLETRPNFLVGLGGGSTLVPDGILTVRFGIEVPVWSRQKQQPLIEEALLGMHAAESDLREQEASVRARLRAALARFRRAEELRTIYQEGLESQASLALQAALAAYRSGIGDFSNVVEDFRDLLEARIALARLSSERYEAWVEIQELVAPVIAAEEASR